VRNSAKHLTLCGSDMVEAWNVDVAAELETYLGELEHIHISFDDSSLNFAQGTLR
jgi:hypothetical protein